MFTGVLLILAFNWIHFVTQSYVRALAIDSRQHVSLTAYCKNLVLKDVANMFIEMLL